MTDPVRKRPVVFRVVLVIATILGHAAIDPFTGLMFGMGVLLGAVVML